MASQSCRIAAEQQACRAATTACNAVHSTSGRAVPIRAHALAAAVQPDSECRQCSIVCRPDFKLLQGMTHPHEEGHADGDGRRDATRQHIQAVARAPHGAWRQAVIAKPGPQLDSEPARGSSGAAVSRQLSRSGQALQCGRGRDQV